MEALGPPIAWLVLQEGTPVYDRQARRIGVVDRVLADKDIFEGVIVHTVPLPGHHRVAAADQIAELRERGVLLSVERDALHEPSKRKPPSSESPEGRLHARLRRTWDWITRRP